MKKYFFKINFLWDTEIDSKEFIITVPVNVSIADIETAMKKAHRFLTSEDEEDSYGVYGRTPEFLLTALPDTRSRQVPKDWLHQHPNHSRSYG